jgi:hypothetical protein
MKGLLTAINTYWDATSALVTDIGPLALHETPPGTTGTYVVLSVVASPTSLGYSTASYTEPTFQFTLRDDDSIDGLTKIEAMIALLDDRVFTISGKQNFGFVKEHDPVPEPIEPPNPDEQGRPSFGWVVTYRAACTV